jgi:hypothetical protein
MPFNFDEYTAWCREWPNDVLQEEYQKYVKQTSQGSAGTAIAYGFAFFTGGLSLIGLALSGPTLANAAAKVDIIRDEMARRKKKLSTRPEDVFKGIALGSTGLITTPALHVLGPVISHASSSVNYHGPYPHSYTSRVER